MFTIERLFTIWHLSPSRCSSDTCCDFPPLLAAFPAKPDHDSSEDSFDDNDDDDDGGDNDDDDDSDSDENW